jgi:hypothetical protein
VIDARGISGSALICPAGTSPWLVGTTYVNKPSEILLPPGVITTSVPWVLPANTKLIGTAKATSVGGIGSGGGYNLETSIQASTSFSGSAIVQFGDSAHCSTPCQGISVEHLTVMGNGSSVANGIENDNWGAQCYVDHLTPHCNA